MNIENIKKVKVKKITEKEWIEVLSIFVEEEVFKDEDSRYHYTAERGLEILADIDHENEKYKIEKVDSYGGEGMGEDYWVIQKITFKETGEVAFVKYDGWYNSWDGAYMENAATVNPEIVEKVQWNRSKSLVTV